MDYGREGPGRYWRTLMNAFLERLERELEFHRKKLSAYADEVSARVCKDLTWPQVRMLMAIQAEGETSVKELSEKLHRSAPSVSVMLWRLTQEGLVVRIDDPGDRRRAIIRLSPGISGIMTAIDQQSKWTS